MSYLVDDTNKKKALFITEQKRVLCVGILQKKIIQGNVTDKSHKPKKKKKTETLSDTEKQIKPSRGNKRNTLPNVPLFSTLCFCSEYKTKTLSCVFSDE